MPINERAEVLADQVTELRQERDRLMKVILPSRDERIFDLEKQLQARDDALKKAHHLANNINESDDGKWLYKHAQELLHAIEATIEAAKGEG